MIDPFLITGPAILNVSGGRTSAYKLRRILDAHGGRLPADVHVAFANTGDEREETLAFLSAIEVRWGVNLRWIERDGSAPAGERFREVEYETASRRCEPFEELIDERRFLPHHGARFCTQEMKIETARAFMHSLGYEHWTSVIGLRRDEQDRVAKHREKQVDEDDFDSVYPLHAAGVTKADVEAFWQVQRGGLPLRAWLALPPDRRPGWDLALRWWESNCRSCFLKSASILERTERDNPGSLAWPAAQERKIGATFVKGRRYLQIIERASRPSLPGMLADPEAAGPLACNCTDRRAPRRCTCGKRRGQGHALYCGHVLGDDPRVAA